MAVRLPALPDDVRVHGMLEWYNPGTVGGAESLIYTGGLNWRVTPAVVVKAECYRMDFRKATVFNTDWWGITSQLAVSF